MALASARVVATAQKIAEVSEKVRNVLAEVHQVLEFNSDQAIDWAAGSKPAYIPEDADGNIDGLQYSRTAVANAIGSLDQFRKLLTNAAVSQGDHLGNLNLVSDPS